MAHLSAHICQLTSLRDAQCMIFGPQLHCTAGRAQRPARWLVAHRQHVPQHFSAAGGKRRQHAPQCCRAAGSDGGNGSGELTQLDANQLQTMLQIAVDSEDFARAGALRDELNARQGGGASGASWAQLGVPDWLVDRAEQLGLRFPTEVQARAAEIVRQRRDCTIQSETGSGKTLSFLMPVLSALDYPPKTPLSDFQGPQCVILVPTRELGVQIAMLVYKLFGGSVNPGIPGQSANMFRYAGPQGLKVRGVLDDEEAAAVGDADALARAHVVVAVPQALAGVRNLAPALARARFVVVDEIDACFQKQSEAMETLLSGATDGKPKPTLVFVGATVQNDLAATAQQMGWMEDPVTVAVGQGGIPRALQHACIECDAGRAIGVLCRQIRADLNSQGDDKPPARVMVFAESEAQAAAMAEPLRNVLWGEHSIAVLLPGGEEPIKAMHAFRDNKASLLVATPAAARGLDLPAVSFVYNVGPPADATDYLHRAGRAGRIGASVPGTVVTLVAPEQRPQLQAIADELHIDIRQQAEPQPENPADSEGQRRALDDLFNLY